MSKGDIKLLITGAIALFMACFLGIITLIAFAIKLGGKAMEYDWKGTFGNSCASSASIED